MKTKYFLFLYLFLSFYLSHIFAQNIEPDNVFEAVKSNNFTGLKKIIDNSFDINTTDSNGASILMWAVYKSDLQMVRYLVKKGADVKKKGRIYLDEENKNYYGNLLCTAAGEGKLDLLKYLIDECKISIDDKALNPEGDSETGWNALQVSCFNNLKDVVQYLISKNANLYIPDEEGKTAYDLTTDSEIKKFFISNGFNVDLNELFYLGLEDSIIKRVSSYKNNYLQKKDGGSLMDSLLHRAFNFNYDKLFNFLLENGADINSQDKNGNLILHKSILLGDGDFVKYLISRGANVNLEDKDGYTPLQLAIGRKNKIIEDILVKNGANPKKYFTQKAKLYIRTGHSYGIKSVVFSPDGKTLASGSGDNTIRLWDVISGMEIVSFTGHSAGINSLAFSPNGNILASGGADNTIKLWDINTCKEIKTLFDHSSAVNSVAFSADGKILASGSDDKTIKLWNATTGKLIKSLLGHSSSVKSINFSPDGNFLGSAGADSIIKLWNINTGKEIKSFHGHTAEINSISFSPDGKILASGGDDNTIRVWDISTGKELTSLIGHSLAITSISISIDGKTLASSSADNTIKLWNMNRGEEIKTLTGHSYSVNSVAFSPDGRIIASGSWDNTIKLWDVNSGKERSTLSGHSFSVNSVAFSPDGRNLASGHGNNSIKMWYLDRSNNIKSFTGHQDAISSICFSPNGKSFASGSWDETIKLWNTSTGKEIRSFSGHTGNVNAVAFSPNGKILGSGSEDNTLKLWNINTGKEIVSFSGHSREISSLAFSPDGKLLASGSWDKTVKLWDLKTGKEMKSLAGHSMEITTIAFSPDGKTLATGGGDKIIKLWDISTGKELQTFSGHSKVIISLAFSPDGNILASGSGDNTIKLWNVNTGLEIKSFLGHSSEISSVSFSPDGRILASGSGDATIKLWNVLASSNDGKELATLIALDSTDWAVVTPDGRFDASPFGMEKMHWVVGIEPVDLNQLKERYYEPGLLQKVLGYNKETMKNVPGFDKVELFPETEIITDRASLNDSTSSAFSIHPVLKVRLKNRGGGIGKVQVFINDKEYIANARGANFNSDAADTVITIDIVGSRIIPNDNNIVRIVSWNKDGYLSSSGTNYEWYADYSKIYKNLPDDITQIGVPELYAIIGGVSHYALPVLDLKYSAKDAEDMAKALELGAKRMFGVDKVHFTILTTSNNPNSIPPSKENFKKAFLEARKSKPKDIFIVYLAGHGVVLRGESDTYCYLTADARGGDFADPAIRQSSVITSDELVDWIKEIPARKQVMIFDACGSGAVENKFVGSRDIPSDQIRAIERVKDRTGFHILMGCSADKVSYESSQYGQGLLTYALLQGMKGAALKEEEYIDIGKLFQYAADEVPQLAKTIGGVQQPRIAAPGGTSFDIGRLTKEDRKAIPLAIVKPMICRPTFLNQDEIDDNLNFTTELRKKLNDENYVSEGGTRDPNFVFVDAEDLPGAIKVNGIYNTKGKNINLNLGFIKDGQKIAAKKIKGLTTDIPGIINKIIETILTTIQIK